MYMKCDNLKKNTHKGIYIHSIHCCYQLPTIFKKFFNHICEKSIMELFYLSQEMCPTNQNVVQKPFLNDVFRVLLLLNLFYQECSI